MNSDVEKFIRLADRLDAKPIDHSLNGMKDTADEWSIEKGIDYVVVKNGGWQVWAKSIADKCSMEYVYNTSVSTSVGGSDDL